MFQRSAQRSVGQRPVDAEAVRYDQDALDTAAGLELRYPPVEQGVPVVTPGQILDGQRGIIEDTRRIAGESNERFAELYIDVIMRLAEYCHLVPASEYSHHRGVGGLFRHSLEVANYCLRAAKGALMVEVSDRARRESEPRWCYGAWLVGLLHDTGKVFRTVLVMSSDGKIWDPYVESLYEWALNEKVDRYLVRWQHRTLSGHERSAYSGFERIVKQPQLRYLSAAQGLTASISDVLTGEAPDTNVLRKLMERYDQESTAADMRLHRTRVFGAARASVESHFVRGLRTLIGPWVAHNTQREVIVTPAGVGLRWPKALDDIIALLRSSGVTTIPYDPTNLVAVLIDYGLIQVWFEGEQPRGFWWFYPESHPEQPRLIVLLRDADTAFENDPVPGAQPGTIVPAEGGRPERLAPPQPVQPRLVDLEGATPVHHDHRKDQPEPTADDARVTERAVEGVGEGAITTGATCQASAGTAVASVGDKALASQPTPQKDNQASQYDGALAAMREVLAGEGDQRAIMRELLEEVVASDIDECFEQNGKIYVLWPDPIRRREIDPNSLKQWLASQRLIADRDDRPGIFVHEIEGPGKSKRKALQFSGLLSRRLKAVLDSRSEGALSVEPSPGASADLPEPESVAARVEGVKNDGPSDTAATTTTNIAVSAASHVPQKTSVVQAKKKAASKSKSKSKSKAKKVEGNTKKPLHAQPAEKHSKNGDGSIIASKAGQNELDLKGGEVNPDMNKCIVAAATRCLERGTQLIERNEEGIWINVSVVAALAELAREAGLPRSMVKDHVLTLPFGRGAGWRKL